VHPHDPPVARDQAVLEIPRLTRLVVPVVLCQDDLAIVGVQELDPDVRLIEPLVACVTEDLLDVWAHEQRAAFVVGSHLVDDRGHPFDERSIPGLRRSDLLLGPSLCRDVLDHALPREALPLLAQHEDAGVPEPDLLPVGPEHPVLAPIRSPRRPYPVPEGQDPLPIVRVHRADPETRVIEEPLCRHAEELLDVGADVDRRGTPIVGVDVDDDGKLFDQLAHPRFRREGAQRFR
jgi:hypothetical protein